MFHFSRTNDALTGVSFASAEAAAGFAEASAAFADGRASLADALVKRAAAGAKLSRRPPKPADAPAKAARDRTEWADPPAQPADALADAKIISAKSVVIQVRFASGRAVSDATDSSASFFDCILLARRKSCFCNSPAVRSRQTKGK
jgi:hypothetical protein